MAQVTVTGAFTATGSSANFTPMPKSPFAYEKGSGYFNITLWGTYSATVVVKRSFDAGVTWHAVSKDSSGADAAYTAPVSLVALEPEQAVVYKLECTAYASGTVNYRISR